MVAYSFKARFVPRILDGTKNQTIRGPRKRHARPGEPMQLFYGMRTRQCRRLGESPCEGVDRIRMELPAARKAPEILIASPDGTVTRIADPRGLDRFAVADGFRDFEDLFAWWRAVHGARDTFEGVRIRWRPLPPLFDPLKTAAILAAIAGGSR